MWPFKRPDFYLSRDWRILRQWALSHYGRKCMKCGAVEGLQIDHILPRSKYPHLELSKHNVGVLCGPCNKTKSAKIERDYRPARAILYSMLAYILPRVILPTLIATMAYGFFAIP